MTTTTTLRLPRPLLGVLLVSALVSALVLSASVARADDTPRIFPLVPTSPLSPELADAPAALTDALAALLDGVTTDRSLEDFARKLRCDVEMSNCLDAIARSLVTGQLVYGTIAPAPAGKLKVKLVRFDSAKAGSEMYQRTFTLTAQTPKRLGKQLARSAAQMFDREPPPEVVERAPLSERRRTEPVKAKEPVRPREPAEPADPVDPTEPTATPEPRPAPAQNDEPAAGRITGSTWAIGGAGALGVAVGAGFLISARGLAASLETAPRQTLDDFRRLTQIERAGRIRTQVGGTLLVVGSAALAGAAVRAIIQRGGGKAKPESESMERSLALVPVEGGGAAVVFSGGLR